MTIAAAQVQMPNGLLLGAGTPYPIEKIEGLRLPGMRSSDTPKQTQNGSFPGRDYLDERIIRITMGIDSSINPTALDALDTNLGGAFYPVATPTLMYLRKRDAVERMAYACPRQLSGVSFDADSALGLPSVVGEIVCPDPLIYGSTTFNAVIPSGGTGAVPNGGNCPVAPVITIVGAATNPTITLGSQQIKTTLAMGGGDTLVIDVAHRTVTLNGANRRDVIDNVNTTWWSLVGGPNLLTESQANLDPNISGWANYSGATVARDTGHFIAAPASLAITAAGAAAMYASTPTGTLGVPVVAGQTYSAMAWFLAATAGRQAQVEIGWYNSSGTLISGTLSSTPITTSTGGWLQATVAGAAPATAAYATVFLSFATAAGSGDVQYADAIGLWNSPLPALWQHGSSNVVGYTGGGTSCTVAWNFSWAAI